MKSLLATLLILSFSIGQETPFTPYKDGYATPSAYNGTSRTLKVHDPDSKAWITHPVGDGAEKGVTKARLQVYVGAVTHPGKLRVFLCSPLGQLEAQTRYNDFQAKDSVGEVSLSYDSLQRMVSIPLSPVFVKALSTYNGLVLEGYDDLEAEIGSLEGGRGALLYLTYADKPDSALVQNVTANLIANHLSEIRGKDGTNGLPGRAGTDGAPGKDGTNGLPGRAGTDGLPGKDGAPGAQGPQGLQGIQGLAGDNSRAFALLQERGLRAQYSFDVFPGRNSSPDSSTWANHLSRSSEGVNLVELNPGDSAAQFLGNGYFKAADSQSLNPFREISLEARIFLSIDAPPDTETILAKSGQYEMAIIGNQLKGRFKTVLGGWEWLGTGAVPANAWHAVKVAYDGRAVRTWVDGAQTYYRAYPNGPLASGAEPLYVGARAPGVAGMKGTVNLVSISGFVVGVQDSLGNLVGRVTRTQVVADSVAGLSDSLSKKANLNGAAFTGPVSVAGSINLQSGRTLITGFDGANTHWFKTSAPEPAGVFFGVKNSAGGPTHVIIAPRNNLGVVVDSAGIVDLPNQSAVYMGNSAGLSLGTTTFQTIPFNTKVLDNQNEYDISTSRFTAKNSGSYSITASISFNSVLASELDIFLNNVRVRGFAHSEVSVEQGTTVIRLNKGDFIDIRVYTTATTGTILPNGLWDWLAINKIN